ncbi:protein Meh1p [Monosporozyma unispora]|nr:hypothetical protein C6P44_000608 [Kazachstania unispora]
MGAAFSCCPFGGSSNGSDEEALLRNQQDGYGSTINGENNQYDAVQEQIREHERRLQARDQELRGIVANTNDKLIDISMISNSGIVVQKNDLYTEDLDEDTTATGSVPTQEERTEADVADGKNGASGLEPTPQSENSTHFTVLNEEKVTPAMKQQLSQLHDGIMNQLNQQLTLEAPQDLTLTF